MLWEAQHKLAKPESKTLTHYTYLKVYNQKLTILVHNFRESPFRSLTLIWTPRISTCFNSSTSWSNYSAIVICSFIIPCNQIRLQENDTSTAKDLNLRKKKNTAVQCISISNSAVLQSCLHMCGAKGGPLPPWWFQMRIFLQGILFPQLYPRHVEDHLKIHKERCKKQLFSSDTGVSWCRFTFLCDTWPSWNWPTTLERTFAGINDHYKSHYDST